MHTHNRDITHSMFQDMQYYGDHYIIPLGLYTEES